MEIKQIIQKIKPLYVFIFLVIITILFSLGNNQDEVNYGQYRCGYECALNRCDFFINEWDKKYTTYVVIENIFGERMIYSENVSDFECIRRSQKYESDIHIKVLKTNDWKNE